MISKKSFISVYFLLLFCSSYSQKTIRIYDSLSSEPVSYAHIYSSEGSMTTISNELGEFEIPASSLVDTLIISHISYNNDTILTRQIKDIQSVVHYLIPNTTILDEVIVFDQNIDSILVEVIDQLKNADVKYGKAFYRQVAFQDSSPTEWIEAFYNISYSKNGIKKVHVDQARFARKQKSIESIFISHTNFSILTVGTQLFTPKNPLGETRAGKPFSEDFMDKYEFSISKTFKKDGDLYLFINFEPGEIRSPVKSYGSFIYNKSKKRLVQYNAKINHALGADDISYSGDDEGSMKNPYHEIQIDFSNQGGSLEFIKVRFSYDLIQNGEVFPSEVTSKFIVYQVEDKPNKRLKEPSLLSEHVSNFENAKYKPKYWRDNPIITLTPEEKVIIATFEEENAFGTYFK